MRIFLAPARGSSLVPETDDDPNSAIVEDEGYKDPPVSKSSEQFPQTVKYRRAKMKSRVILDSDEDEEGSEAMNKVKSANTQMSKIKTSAVVPEIMFVLTLLALISAQAFRPVNIYHPEAM